MNHTRLVSWDMPALLSEGGPSSNPRAKSRRRHHEEFLATQKPPVSKPPVAAAPKTDRGKPKSGQR